MLATGLLFVVLILLALNVRVQQARARRGTSAAVGRAGDALPGACVMRAVEIPKYGAPEVLQVIERRRTPSPVRARCSIDVAPAGVNFADTLARVGLYADAPKPPMVVGYEVAGTIADGRRRRRSRCARRRARHGGHAVRRLRVARRRRRRRCDPAAEGLSVRAGRRDPGQLRDGVGRAHRLRLAAARGRRCSSRPRPAASASRRRRSPSASAPRSGAPRRRRKHDAIRANGVDHAVDYRKRRVVGGPAAVRPDPRRDRRPSFQRSYAMLRAGGRLVAFGASSVSQRREAQLPADARPRRCRCCAASTSSTRCRSPRRSSA